MIVSTQRKLLDTRPQSIVDKLGSKSEVCLLNSRDIFNAIKNEKIIIMACNIRVKHVVPGIMKAAEKLDAVVAFELAKSEGGVDGGYTGQTPQIFFDTLIGYAEQTGYSKPFFIHGDHITVKDTSQKAIQSAREFIDAELKAGHTSFAIDASFNELQDNIRITTDLAGPIILGGWGLEVEVGEIKSAGTQSTLTTTEEATSFIDSLIRNGVHPNLLAINNGSKHGNYLAGEKIFIDLERTGEIYDRIKDKGVCIAQHGITGTPLGVVGRFADCGIRKGNVGTEWQNIAHQFLPGDLMAQMKSWAKQNNKDIKFANREFKKEIDSIPEEHKKQIEEKACQKACEFIEAFRARGSASLVKTILVG